MEFSVAEGVEEHLVKEEGKAVEQAQQEEIVGEIEEEQMPYDALSQQYYCLFPLELAILRAAVESPLYPVYSL